MPTHPVLLLLLSERSGESPITITHRVRERRVPSFESAQPHLCPSASSLVPTIYGKAYLNLDPCIEADDVRDRLGVHIDVQEDAAICAETGTSEIVVPVREGPVDERT